MSAQRRHINLTTTTQQSATHPKVIHTIHSCDNMDISLLLEPQAKHQRMHRGDSMYDEQSVIELETIRCKHCQRGFIPSAYVRHCNSGKPMCTISKKRPTYDSTRKRIMNNPHLTATEKKRILRATKKTNGKTRFSTRRKCSSKRNWRDDSNQLRAAMGLLLVAKKAKLAERAAKRAKLAHSSVTESIYNLV